MLGADRNIPRFRDPCGRLALAGGERAGSQTKEPGTLGGVAQGLSSDVILFPDFGRSSGNN